MTFGVGHSNLFHVSYEAEKCINLSRFELQFSRDQRNQVQAFTTYHQSIQHVQLLLDGVAAKYKRKKTAKKRAKNCEKYTKKARKQASKFGERKVL